MAGKNAEKKNKALLRIKRMKQLCVGLVALIVVQIIVISACSWHREPTKEEQVKAAAPETSAPTEQTLPPETMETTAPMETTVPETTVPETLPPETIPEETEPEETEPSKIHTGAIEEIPLFYQTDFPDEIYGSGTVSSSGCSITSLAMVASYLTDHLYMPDELADYFGGCADNNIERLEYASDALQLPYEARLNFDETMAELREGNIAIALMDSDSIFTDSQHFIVLAGYNDDGKIVVYDPYEPNYSHWQLERALEEGFEPGDICAGFSGGWVYKVDDMPEEPFIYVEEVVEVEYRYEGLELTDEEKYLLAQMIWVEAQGEPREGQQAVAEVVLNRLAADNFPDTLRNVIYAQGQFRSVPHLEDAKPNQTQYEAVERALYGPYILPMDVVFFATYPVNDNVWGEIGGHVFCHQW